MKDSGTKTVVSWGGGGESERTRQRERERKQKRLSGAEAFSIRNNQAVPFHIGKENERQTEDSLEQNSIVNHQNIKLFPGPSPAPTLFLFYNATQYKPPSRAGDTIPGLVWSGRGVLFRTTHRIGPVQFNQSPRRPLLSRHPRLSPLRRPSLSPPWRSPPFFSSPATYPSAS